MDDERQIAINRAPTISTIHPDFVIRETSKTRLVARRALVATKDTPPKQGVNFTLIHQTRSSNDSWIDVPAKKLNTLKVGEGYRLKLNSAAAVKLRQCISELFEASARVGVQWGTKELHFFETSEIVRVPKNRKKLIEAIVDQGYPEEVWRMLAEKDPDLATRLSMAQMYADRARVLKEFKAALDAKYDERWWQAFFSKNKWIFG